MYYKVNGKLCYVKKSEFGTYHRHQNYHPKLIRVIKSCVVELEKNKQINMLKKISLKLSYFEEYYYI